jgi:hypothetical protein
MAAAMFVEATMSVNMNRLVGDTGCGLPLSGFPNGVGRRSLIPLESLVSPQLTPERICQAEP